MDKMYPSLINYHYGMYLLERDPKLYVDYMNKEEKMKRGCYNCKYLYLSVDEEPCVRCNIIKNMWESREEKTMEKEFTKDMLENRMVVEFRNGNRYLVVDNYLIGYTGYNPLECYDEYLKEKHDNKDLDIVKVYDKIRTFRQVDDGSAIYAPESSYLNIKLLWEREDEPKEVTMEEVCEKFGCEVKIVNG